MSSDDVVITSPAPNAVNRRGMPPVLLALVLAIVVIALGAIALAITHGTDGTGPTDSIRENRFQAVYMSDGSVYFGKVRDVHGDWFTLKNGFFLRRSTSDQTTKDGKAASTTELVKVNQVVGGDGDLVINSREVSLVQNLTASSDVAQFMEDALKS